MVKDVAPPNDEQFGTLNDVALHKFASGGMIGSYSKSNVKQCCYEARAGRTYYDLSLPENDRRKELQPGHFIVLKPKQFVTLITMESFKLPSDMVARILTKGRLFSLGVLPINTYADPGFSGHLGITMYNGGNNFIKIPIGEPIAKIEFCRLASPVASPYSGQHGFQTGIWPIPTHLLMSPAEIAGDPRIGAFDIELARSHGSQLASVFARITRFERWFVISAGIYFSVMFLLILKLSQDQTITNFLSIGLGVLANIITMLITWFATRTKA